MTIQTDTSLLDDSSAITVSPALVKLTKTELNALILLNDNPFYVITTAGAMESLAVNQIQARRALRSLVRKSLAERSTAYNEDDGLIHGSGYVVTKLGAAQVMQRVVDRTSADKE